MEVECSSGINMGATAVYACPQLYLFLVDEVVMEPTKNELKQRYSELSVDALIELHDNAELTEIGQQALAEEFKERQIVPKTREKSSQSNTNSNKKGHYLWPNVEEEKGRNIAINAGVFAALWIAGSCMVSAIYVVYTGESLHYGVVPIDMVRIWVVGSALLVCLFLFLAWRIWAKAGYISALLLFLWMIFEIYIKATMQGLHGNWAFTIIVLLAVFHGMRGTHMKKLLDDASN